MDWSVFCFETIISWGSVINVFFPAITLKDGITSLPWFLAIKVQDIDLEEVLSPLINLYSLPIFGPEIIEKKSSICEISTDGFSSISEIFIVNIIDSVILIFFVETDDDISCGKAKPKAKKDN